MSSSSSSSSAKQAVPLSDFLNEQFKGASATKIALTTAGIFAVAEFVRTCVLPAPVLITARDNFLHFIRRRVLKNYLESEINKNISQIKFPQGNNGQVEIPRFSTIPENGLADDQVIGISKMHHDVLDKKFEDSHLSGAVYHGTLCPTEFYVKIFEHHIWSNALFADYFGATRKMEGEVIEMGVNLFNGDLAAGNCAAMTSGGSESIAMALLAYRNRAYVERGITSPNIVCCVTCHPAFDKAAGYYGIRLIKVPCNPTTFRFDAADAARHLTEDTVAIVGSAPSYAHGVVDPIADLAALAKARGIGMHVDACVGGFFIQFLDAPVQPIIDFRVDGVTSISADIHKWGGTPKGASLVLYRSKELRSYQIFACSSFPGGLYASMGPSGSKAGYTAAFAWAAFLKFGRNGYHDLAERTRVAAQKFRWAVEGGEIPGLEIMGDPQLSIVACSSSYYDIYLFSNKMKERGWLCINLQFPPGIHLGLTLDHAAPGAMEKLIADAKQIASSLMPDPDPKTGRVEKRTNISYAATLYGSSQTIPDRGSVDMMLKAYVAKTVDVEGK